MKLSLCFLVALPLLLNPASLENEKRVIFEDFNLGRKHYIFVPSFLPHIRTVIKTILLLFMMMIIIIIIIIIIVI